MTKDSTDKKMAVDTVSSSNNTDADNNQDIAWVEYLQRHDQTCKCPISQVRPNGHDRYTRWEKIEEKPVKIDKWDAAALKNALDDAAKKVMLEKFGLEESHRLMDGRLLICTIAVGFAMSALVWDYLRPFPESRPVLITCVLSYFLLMGVLTVYTTYMEKGIFLVALDKDKAGVDPDNAWYLSSALKKYDDAYTLSFTYEDGTTKKSRSGEITRSVAKYFDENGLLCFDLFEPEVRRLQNRIATDKRE